MTLRLTVNKETADEKANASSQESSLLVSLASITSTQRSKSESKKRVFYYSFELND